MQAGKLRHLITIQELALGSPQYHPNGESNEEWGTFGTVWAAFEPLQGNELFRAQAINSEIKARVTIRYLAGVEPDMRIVFEGKYYNILSVIDRDMRHVEMQLMVSEGLNLG